jgi:hypothetical protein
MQPTEDPKDVYVPKFVSVFWGAGTAKICQRYMS